MLELQQFEELLLPLERPVLRLEFTSFAAAPLKPTAAFQADSIAPPDRVGEQIPVEEVETTTDNEIQYPNGPQLWINTGTILILSFIGGLDVVVIAVVVPSLTDQFKTISDIGWYSAIFGLMLSSSLFFASKLYTVFDLKLLLVITVLIFEVGSILCTFAPSSSVFILGRAIAGVGTAGYSTGCYIFIPRYFPQHKRPLINSFLGFAQSIGLVIGPVIGGALIYKFTWRACFGINIPIGIIAAIIIAYQVNDPNPAPELSLPIREKLIRLDPVGTLLIIPCVMCLMMALQWGGIKYQWNDWRIITLLVLFAVLAVGFAFNQHRQQDKAVLPPRLLKNRTVLAGMLFAWCCNGILACTEYYISIYFQGVRGYTALQSGALALSMVIGFSFASLAAGYGITWIGYYTPFMIITTVLAPIASGLFITIKVSDPSAKVTALLGFLGVAIGFGFQVPSSSIMVVMPPEDVATALGATGFCFGMGSSFSMAVSALVFSNRLAAQVSKYVPGFRASSLVGHGLLDLQKSVDLDQQQAVLLGYHKAIIQTLYVPLCLGCLTLISSATMDWRPVKKAPFEHDRFASLKRYTCRALQKVRKTVHEPKRLYASMGANELYRYF